MSEEFVRRAIAAMRRRPSIPAIWMTAVLVGWYAVELDYDSKTGPGGSIAEEMLKGTSEKYDDMFEADLAAAALLSGMRTAVAIRDAGAENDWSSGKVRYGGVETLRHGDAEIPVPDLIGVMGFSTRQDPIAFETDAPPLVPLWLESGRSYETPLKGRLVFVLDTRNPQTCRRVVAAISGYPSVVANFEATYPASRDPVRGDVWFPLDPGRSRVLEEMCASQFEGGDFETGRYVGGPRQKLKFRLAGEAWRSSVSDAVMDIPPP